MTYKINPCKACLEKFDRGDVNNINNCCYDTLTAFSNSTSVNSVRGTEQAKNCIECVGNAMRDIGRNYCNLQLSPPPIWNQVPHYFPGYLDNGHSVEDARNLCLKKCDSLPNTSIACKENCVTDASAVVEERETYQACKKKNVSPFYIGYFATNIIVITIVVIAFIISLARNN